MTASLDFEIRLVGNGTVVDRATRFHIASRRAHFLHRGGGDHPAGTALNVVYKGKAVELLRKDGIFRRINPETGTVEQYP